MDRDRGIAALWGFAEATLFFFVPDVWLSAVALRDVRESLRCCLWALAGALAGGVLMYLWGAADPAAAASVLDRIPAISPGMLARVRDELAGRGFLAVVLGPLSGTPYKIYAVQAGALGMGLPGFLLATVPARLVRFVLVTLLAAGLARVPPLRGISPPRKRLVHALAWTTFYGVYLTAMPW